MSQPQFRSCFQQENDSLLDKEQCDLLSSSVTSLLTDRATLGQTTIIATPNRGDIQPRTFRAQRQSQSISPKQQSQKQLLRKPGGDQQDLCSTRSLQRGKLNMSNDYQRTSTAVPIGRYDQASLDSELAVQAERDRRGCVAIYCRYRIYILIVMFFLAVLAYVLAPLFNPHKTEKLYDDEYARRELDAIDREVKHFKNIGTSRIDVAPIVL